MDKIMSNEGPKILSESDMEISELSYYGMIVEIKGQLLPPEGGSL